MNNGYYLVRAYEDVKIDEYAPDREGEFMWYASNIDLNIIIDIISRLYLQKNDLEIYLIKEQKVIKIFNNQEINKLLLLS